MNQVDSWITIDADNTVTLKTSQIETGQRDHDRLPAGRWPKSSTWTCRRCTTAASTTRTPADRRHLGRRLSTGGEGGSNAMSGTGPKIRNVGALARAGAARHGLDEARRAGREPDGRQGRRLGRRQDASPTASWSAASCSTSPARTSNLQPGVAPAKPFSAYKTVLKDPNPVVRIDIPDKVTGKYTYVHQVRVPGMLHGRMVRPRGQGAYPYNSNVPVSVDATSIAHIPGAQVVHVNNFLGVVAPKEYDAIQAAAQLKVVWNTNPILPGTGNLWKHYRDARRGRQDPGDGRQHLEGQRRRGARLGGAHGVGHASPITTRVTCRSARAAASPTSGRTRRRSGATPRTSRTCVTDLTNVLSPLPAKQIRVLFYEGAGSFGNGCVAFDTAESAAIMSKARRQAGAPADDALGRARLDALRARRTCTTCGPASTRAATSSPYEATGFGQGGTSLYTGRELAGPVGARPRPRTPSRRTVNGGGAVTENLLAVDEGHRTRTTS